MNDPTRFRQLYSCSRVPLLQNSVYTDQLEAKSARAGRLDIVHDLETGHSFNAAFDERLTLYDQDYDNSVPSKVFMRYYDEIADYLVRAYRLENGTVFDVGCGKGTFLKRIADNYSEVRGIGIDPSYQGDSTTHAGRLRFIAEHFSRQHISEEVNPSIVLCRHVIEHIPSPSKFLEVIFEPFSCKNNVPVFIEVPDISWIIENHAFWDFCHEHVNYFSHDSLRSCIAAAGGRVTRIAPAFGGQYIWGEAILNPTEPDHIVNGPTVGEPHEERIANIGVGDDYFKEQINLTVEKISKLSLEREIVIWGMATKGIMYSLNLIENGITVPHCVDINVAKQGKFTPLSGLEIRPPERLPRDGRYAIICMNPNYAREIESTCRELGIDGVFLNPDGDSVHS